MPFPIDLKTQDPAGRRRAAQYASDHKREARGYPLVLVLIRRCCTSSASLTRQRGEPLHLNAETRHYLGIMGGLAAEQSAHASFPYSQSAAHP